MNIHGKIFENQARLDYDNLEDTDTTSSHSNMYFYILNRILFL
jgi:hypothetical protein